jgi:integrase
LQVTRSRTGGINRNWVFRFQFDGSRDPETGRVTGRHDLGIGPLHTISLAEARETALGYRKQIKAGINPLDAKIADKADRKLQAQAARAERARALTFKDCADRYISVRGAKWTNAKHAAQWRATLRQHAYPIIGDLNVADIDEAHLVQVLAPLYKTIPETARRLRGRIESVLGFATVSKFRHGDNPARWKHHLQILLDGAAKTVEHHAALPFVESPGFMAELRQQQSTVASALEFLILTAARTGEITGAKWSEIDIKNRAWTIPAERMKSGREHRVPLPGRAVEILNGLDRRGDLVFARGVTGRALRDAALLELLQGMRPGVTVHGFRSAFRDWCAEKTSYPHDVVELSLAHAVGDAVVKAYKRTDLFDKRRRLMEAWAAFLAKPLPAEGAKIVRLRA